MNFSKEYIKIVKPILEHPEFIKRKEYKHHERESVYEHSLIVSYNSYKIAKMLGLDYKSAAIGGLLHDFYRYPWQLTDQQRKELQIPPIKKGFFNQHGFTHARDAMLNAREKFPELMNKKIENIILRHMFPLTPIPPKYREGWIVTYVDKYKSMNVLKSPKELPKYIGVKRKNKKRK